MKISHTDLEACRRCASSWVKQQLEGSRGPRWSYRRATVVAIYYYHRGRNRAESQEYLTRLLSRLRLTRLDAVNEMQESLDNYIDWVEETQPIVAMCKLRVNLRLDTSCVMVGEVARVDVDPEAGRYRAVLLGTRPPDWRNELRLSLLQRAVAMELQRPEYQISVGHQNIDGSSLDMVSFSKAEIDHACSEASELAGLLTEEWRRQSVGRAADV